MAKETEKVLDKKTIEKYRKEIIEDFEVNYKDNLVKGLADDVRDSFDSKYKEDIKNDLTEEVKDEVKERIVREEQKLSTQKSLKIFRLSIYIIVLIAIIGYVFYRLYITNNLGVIKCNNSGSNEQVTTEVINNDEEVTTKLVKDLNYYKKLYGNLLDNIHITNYELLKSNIKVSDISNADKLAMAYENIGDDNISIEGSLYSFDSSKLKIQYEDLFGIDDYKAENFSVDGLNYIYSSKGDNYIAISDNKLSDELVNEIIDIKEDGENIKIKTIVAVIKDGKVFNINDLNKSVSNYSEDIKLSSIGDKLSKVTYTFVKSDSKYFLDSISNE